MDEALINFYTDMLKNNAKVYNIETIDNVTRITLEIPNALIGFPRSKPYLVYYALTPKEIGKITGDMISTINRIIGFSSIKQTKLANKLEKFFVDMLEK